MYPALTNTKRTILVILAFTATSVAQWDRQSPVPTHLDIRGVGSPTSSRVFVATDDNSFDDGGSLFESTDGGSTWTQRNVPQSLSNPMNGIFFLNNQNGWVFGNENYRTTDGGTTWTALPFLGSTYFMEFYTPAFGLASGNFDHFVSHDSGTSWVESPNRIVAFDFIDALTGLGVGDSGIYRTTDGGATFTQVHSGSGSAIAFLSNTGAVAIVDSAFVFSTDGGVTWSVGSPAIGKTELKAISPDVVLAWGRTGDFPDYDDRVLRSSDGGQTWNDLGEVIPEGIVALTVVDPSRVVAASLAGNMFLSTDAGASWTQTFSTFGQQPGYLSSAVPVFPDTQTGYFGYGTGFIIKTTDGGASWFQISSGTGQSLNDVGRFPDGNMIAVGDNGMLLTNEGTSRWSIQQPFTSSNLTAVHIIGQADAVVVDETGRVYQTTNAGSSWSAVDSVPDLTPAKDLHFSSPLDGWVTGSGFSTGALFHTTDGGHSWTAVPDFLGAYVAVDAAGPNVWAANVSGVYQRSTDNGATWIEGQLPDFPAQVQDMEFMDENTGYAAGSWGYVARTTDGGATWTTLSTPNNTHHFTDIHISSASEFWLSTTNNLAYYSANAGQSWSALEIQSEGFGTFASIVASDSGESWSVGFQGYIEHFAGPPPPPPNIPPVVSFNFMPSGMTVYFTDTSHDPDGSVVSWLWDFGDSTFSTEQHPSHTFAVPNTYIIRLTVYDNEGDSGATGRIIVVQPNPGGTFGDFTEVTPIDSVFVTPQDEDFWVITTAPADYDGDGDLDIAVLGYYVVYNQSVEDRLLLLKNNGVSGTGEWGFTYVNVPLGTLTTGSSDMAWGDLDGDGDPDLAVGTDGATVVYRNDAGTLSLLEAQLPAYWEDNDQADFDLRSITWADYDNDGDQDLLLPSVFDDSTFSYRTALMRNDGPNGGAGWNFTEVEAGFVATSHAQSLWADFDGDLDLDLLLVNIAPLTDDGFIRRYRNDGGGVFVGEDILDSLSVEHGEVQWGDYDSDGDLDVLVVGNVKELDGTYTHMAFRIYRNDTGTHVQQDLLDCIPCGGWFDLTAATWADYDTDGDMDILLAGTYNSGSQIEGRATIYENVNGVFADSGSVLPAPRASGDRGGTFSWLDIDGEGDLDYFIAGQYFVPGGNGLVEAQMHVYRNDAPGQNAPPSAPAGLNSVVDDSSTVTLSWNPSSDDNTLPAALTYDLQLFRNGVPVSTVKRLPEPGNISAITQWQLAGLPDGEYHWTVRGVDASYTSSTIAIGPFSLGAVSVDDSSATIPKRYSLEQNYPNPFNPTTTIEFSIARAGFVTLALYNILGQEVKSLVKEERAAGTYRMVLDADGLPSGTYIYQLRAGSVVQTKKLLLVK